MQDAKGLDKYAPYDGADIRTPHKEQYELFVRMPGQPWKHSVTVENAALVWACMSYIRWLAPHVPCKVIKKGAST